MKNVSLALEAHIANNMYVACFPLFSIDLLVSLRVERLPYCEGVCAAC